MMDDQTIKFGIYARFFKRPMDFLLSLIALIILSPLLLVIALLVRIKLGSPVLFKQRRPGKNEKIFTLYKFRSMTDEKDEQGNLLPDSERLTKFGKFLRSTSIDELPELLNILKGDMSIVGPRPLLIEYLPYYKESETLRHYVRPGLTGYAQVSGRNFLDWDARLAKDVQYIKKISLRLDLFIIIKTIYKVIKREGLVEDTNLIEGNLKDIRKDK